MGRKPSGRKRGRKPRGSSPENEYPEGSCSAWPPALLERHSRFLDFYLSHFNGSRAAVEVGYSKRSAPQTAHDILNRHDVRTHLKLRRLEHSERVGDVSRERWERELGAVALANMADFAPMFGDGDPAEKLANLTRDQAAVVAEITVEEFRDGRTRARQVRRTKFKLVPKAKGLELLGMAKGWITEKVDHKHSHLHQGLILHSMLKEIAAGEVGKPIVEVEVQAALSAPIIEPQPEEAA